MKIPFKLATPGVASRYDSLPGATDLNELVPELLFHLLVFQRQRRCAAHGGKHLRLVLEGFVKNQGPYWCSVAFQDHGGASG